MHWNRQSVTFQIPTHRQINFSVFIMVFPSNCSAPYRITCLTTCLTQPLADVCDYRVQGYLNFKTIQLPYRLLAPGLLSQYNDSLPAGRSGYRIPWSWGFSAAVQKNPGAHPPFNILVKSTESLPRVKHPGRGVNHPPSRSITSLPLGLHSWLYGNLPLFTSVFTVNTHGSIRNSSRTSKFYRILDMLPCLTVPVYLYMQPDKMPLTNPSTSFTITRW
jgi:hypothetical protein